MLIGELAKASGTTKDTIRHYDQLGLLISAERQAGSRTYKEYSEDNLERLEMIRLAKYMGFTLNQIAQQTEKYYQGGLTLQEQIAMLESRLEDVKNKLQEMQQVEQYLTLKIARMKNGDLASAESCVSLHQQVQQDANDHDAVKTLKDSVPV